MHVGPGQQGLEIAVVEAAAQPPDGVLHAAWETRRARRATPVLVVAVYGDHAALCGATGEKPPVHADLNRGQAERLCREALQQPDRHAALRFLAQALPSLATRIPGIRNEGLLALHELEQGAPSVRTGRMPAPAPGEQPASRAMTCSSLWGSRWSVWTT